MSDSDRPTSEMPVLPHVCQPDKDGWCGDARLVCKKCKHRGMETLDGDHSGDKDRCPKCGSEAVVDPNAALGSEV